MKRLEVEVWLKKTEKRFAKLQIVYDIQRNSVPKKIKSLLKDIKTFLRASSWHKGDALKAKETKWDIKVRLAINFTERYLHLLENFPDFAKAEFASKSKAKFILSKFRYLRKFENEFGVATKKYV